MKNHSAAVSLSFRPSSVLIIGAIVYIYCAGLCRFFSIVQ